MPEEKMPQDKPAVADGIEKKKPMPESEPVVVFSKWCKGCGICVEFCPTKALVMGPEGRPVLSDVERCSSCGMCEIRCPDFGISVPGRRRGSKAG
jgi:2-oxoglutarate ferredoxin oxidoreductase subunit delta